MDWNRFLQEKIYTETERLDSLTAENKKAEAAYAPKPVKIATKPAAGATATAPAAPRPYLDHGSKVAETLRVSFDREL